MENTTNMRSGPRRARVLAITSGKGGVGKTSVCVNLAVAMARTGLRIVVVDVDLGLANTHILMGMKPQRTLSDYLEGRAHLPEIVQHHSSGAKFISGGSGIQEMANLDEGGRSRIVRAIQDLQPFCDVILLDTGAGASRSVTDFVALADHALVVTTSNFAAIADAYGIIKIMVQDGFNNPMHVIVNRARSPEEADQVFAKLNSCTQRFLNRDLNWLGLIPEDQSVESAVIRRSPYIDEFPDSVSTKYLMRLVRAMEPLAQAEASTATAR